MTSEELHDLAGLVAKYLHAHPISIYTDKDRIRVLTGVSDDDLDRLVKLVETYMGAMT